MISKRDLRKLVDQKLKDADALMAKKRYATAIYIGGYAIELALKLKICRIFKFSQGFPENRLEFTIYQSSSQSQQLLVGAITQIREIRNHDLNKLLFYSGVEYQIKLNYLTEWALVSDWDPEMRYRVQKISKNEALNNISAIKILIKNIL